MSEPKKRRICASKNWFFTWNNYPENWLQDFLPKVETNCKLWVFEKEVGNSGTPHIQGKIQMKTKGRPMETFKIPEIHWEKSAVWDGHEYCAKDGTQEGVDIWFGGFEPVLKPKIYGWQKELADQIPNLKVRKIYWFWEAEGGKGKSDFMLWMRLTYGKKVLKVGGKGNDIKCAIAMRETKPKYVLVDVSRSAKDFMSYSALEEVSNGYFFNGKYESGEVIMAKPIIIVFANQRPDTSTMSADRWEIKEILPSGCVEGPTGIHSGPPSPNHYFNPPFPGQVVQSLPLHVQSTEQHTQLSHDNRVEEEDSNPMSCNPCT